jgi:Na+/H+ antiporter NhaC
VVIIYMQNTLNLEIYSLLPLIIALLIAFKTRSAVFSLFTGCFVGVVMLSFGSGGHSGNPLVNLNNLFQNSLGNADFIWICLIVFLIGILFELFKHAGVIQGFTQKMSLRANSQKSVGFTAWLMGLVIVDDYFSPLMSGAVMRPLSDKVKMSREKLAFILDSTTASVCILMPFMAWGTMMTGLIKAQGVAVESIEQAFSVFLHSIPYNFYSILLLFFTLGIVLKIIPDFGPMKKAEIRAQTTGKVIRDGGMPLLDSDDKIENKVENVNLVLDFLVPVLIVFGSIITSLWLYGSVMIVESFMAAILYLMAIMSIRKRFESIEQFTRLVLDGIKDVMPAIIIIALAYSINAVTKELGAAAYIVNVANEFITPSLLVAMTFILTALFSFATGTSWGAYALMIPLSLPIAYSLNGGVVDQLLLQTVAAIAGGGIFGDHASPVSDTSILASTGAGSDHMDHVITQLPYALSVALITTVIYLLI